MELNKENAIKIIKRSGKTNFHIFEIYKFIDELFNIIENQKCSNCKYFSNNICSLVEIDDEYYENNFFGLRVEVLDNQGLSVDLRVNDNFYCNCFKIKG